jgi:hypothetical protein
MRFAGPRNSVAAMNRLLLPLLVAALAVPAAAQASERVGVDPDAVYGATPQTCDDGCTIVQDVNANLAVRVPALAGGRGVITSWKVRGSDGSARLRRVEGVTARGATAWATLTGDDQTAAASLPVRSGDRIGVDLSAGATIAGDESFYGDTALAWKPALGDSETSNPDDEIGGYVAYQAIVEPDVDGDGRGDETQDTCVRCGGGGVKTPPPPAPEDPYAAVRKAGPRVALPGSGSLAKRNVSVTVSNPYAFALTGKLTLKKGRKVAARARVKLAASESRTVNLTVKRALARKRKLKLTAIAVMKAPVGKARTTRRKLTVTKLRPAKGVNGKYGGSGLSAGWVMVIENGVVENFNGSMTLYCTKQKEQETVTFAMVGDDPKPHVATDGTFAWEATKNYGFQKLKFSGRVSGGQVTGKIVVEDRPLIPGTDPVTGMPRIEAEYCFAGADYTLTRK